MVKQTPILLLLTLLAALCVTTANAANIITRTDRSDINLNESFTLFFQAEGRPDGDPDFAPLEKDFEIGHSGQSSNFSIINGRSSRQITWTLVLFPKRAGNITIPSIAFGKDFSPQLQITVNQPNTSKQGGQGSEDLYIEVTASPRKAYEQGQILYKVKLFRGVNISNAQLSEPETVGVDVVTRAISDGSEYDTTVGGRPYRVYERRYVIFPQAAGKLTINPIRLDASVGQQRRSFFDSFNGRGRRVRVASKAVHLEVKAIPNSVNSLNWLPARKLEISDSWSPQPPTFTVGEPVTRTITLKAEGVTAAQLPDIAEQMQAQGFKVYPDQAQQEEQALNNGMVGIRIESAALVPTQAGQLSLPAIEIPWWNVKTDKAEVARLPAKTVNVAAAAGSELPDKPASIDNNTSNPIDAGEREAQTTTVYQRGFWPWLSAILGLGWLATAIAWAYQRYQPQQTRKPPTVNLNKLAAKVRQACDSNDAQQSQRALLTWAKHFWQDKPPYSLGLLAAQVPKPLSGEVTALNTALYGKSEHDWQGDALKQAFSTFLKEKPLSTDNSTPDLAPLHKINS